MTIGLFGAFAGGLLTILSPCSVMLLPAFFSYAFNRPSVLVARTGAFYAGLVTTLVPFGLLAGSLGAFVGQHRFVLIGWASVIVIILGSSMLLGVRLPRIFGGSELRGTGGVAVYILGTVYGLAGACAGPLLGAVLTMAALSGNALGGGLTLLVFAAGMVVPLLTISVLWGHAPLLRRLLRPREIRIGRWRNDWVSAVSGVLTLCLGVFLLLTEGTTSLGGVVGARAQARFEVAVQEVASGVPDWVACGASVMFGCLIWAFVAALRSKAGRSEAGCVERGTGVLGPGNA